MPIKLNWVNRVEADEIRVYRSTATMDPNALPTPLATLAADVLEYLDEAVAPDTTYYYRVAAVLTSASPEQLAVSAELEITNYGGVIVSSPSGGGGGSPPSGTFPYSLPILSIEATTGDPTDWTRTIGGPLTVLSTSPGPDLWVVSADGTDRAQHYQDFDVGADRHSTIDAGRCVLDISHEINTFASDTDSAIAFVEFYDDASPAGYLGKAFNLPPYNPDTLTTASRTGIMVPPGTRVIRAGWQGATDSGVELSVYVRNIEVTLREDNAHITDVVSVFAEKGASSTGFTTVTNTPEVRVWSGTNDWEWSVEDFYMGASFSTSAGKKTTPTIPSGWGTKIAAGNVRARLTAQIFTANLGDDAGIGITFIDDASPAGTSYQGTGRVDMTFNPGEGAGNEISMAWVDCPVPSDTTDLELLMEWWRVGGTVSDAAINNISLMFYEETGVETLFNFVHNTSRNAYTDHTCRVVPTPSALPSPLPAAASKIRITLAGHPTGHARLTKMFVGKKSGTYGFAEAPTPVTFCGGSVDYPNDIPPTVRVASDVIDFDFDPSVDELVISFYCSASTSRDDYSARGTSLYDTYEKSGGDDSENLSPTGYSLYDGLVLVEKVELIA
jgi:hypothetical protein